MPSEKFLKLGVDIGQALCYIADTEASTRVRRGCSSPATAGGEKMVTYSDLFLFCDVIIGLISLILLMRKK